MANTRKYYVDMTAAADAAAASAAHSSYEPKTAEALTWKWGSKRYVANRDNAEPWLSQSAQYDIWQRRQHSHGGGSSMRANQKIIVAACNTFHGQHNIDQQQQKRVNIQVDNDNVEQWLS